MTLQFGVDLIIIFILAGNLHLTCMGFEFAGITHDPASTPTYLLIVLLHYFLLTVCGVFPLCMF